jgi:hypothetical protein
VEHVIIISPAVLIGSLFGLRDVIMKELMCKSGANIWLCDRLLLQVHMKSLIMGVVSHEIIEYGCGLVT